MIQLARAETLVKSAPARREKLAVGVLPTAATDLLPRAALAFHDTHPNCLLRVSTGPNWLLMSQLREGSLDLVIGRMASAEAMANLAFHPLYSEQIAAVVRRDHPLLTNDRPAAALEDFPLILPPPGAVIAPVVRAFLARMNISTEIARYETVSLAFGRRVLLDSDAVWFISYGVVRDELDAGMLATLPLDSIQQGGPVGISMRLDGPMTPEQEGLIDALQASAAVDQKGSPT